MSMHRLISIAVNMVINMIAFAIVLFVFAVSFYLTAVSYDKKGFIIESLGVSIVAFCSAYHLFHLMCALHARAKAKGLLMHICWDIVREVYFILTPWFILEQLHRYCFFGVLEISLIAIITGTILYPACKKGMVELEKAEKERKSRKKNKKHAN